MAGTALAASPPASGIMSRRRPRSGGSRTTATSPGTQSSRNTSGEHEGEGSVKAGGRTCEQVEPRHPPRLRRPDSGRVPSAEVDAGSSPDNLARAFRQSSCWVGGPPGSSPRGISICPARIQYQTGSNPYTGFLALRFNHCYDVFDFATHTLGNRHYLVSFGTSEDDAHEVSGIRFGYQRFHRYLEPFSLVWHCTP